VDENDPRGEEKGPKLHPHCWDAFAADQDGRCHWCFKPIASQSTAPRDGFVPDREISDKGQSAFGRDGHWGRGHVTGAPKGGAGGTTQGDGKVAFHQGCVDKAAAHAGNKCLWCKRPIHLGLEIPGRGQVHKGFCNTQLQLQMAEEARQKALEDAEKEKLEFQCTICGKEIDEGDGYYTMPDDEGGGHCHIHCFEEHNACVHCKKVVVDEFFEVDKDGRKGKVHVDCWDEYKLENAPRCLACGKAVVGPHYTHDDGRVHIDCWEDFLAQQGIAESCAFCNEPIASQYYEAPPREGHDAEKVHLHCWVAFCEREGIVEESAQVKLQRGSLGWFRKQGRMAKTWQLRWAAIHEGHLCYFTDDSFKVLKGSVPLGGATISALELSPRGSGAQLGFEVAHGPSGRKLRAYPDTSARRVGKALPPATEDDRTPWLRAIKKAIDRANGRLTSSDSLPAEISSNSSNTLSGTETVASIDDDEDVDDAPEVAPPPTLGGAGGVPSLSRLNLTGVREGGDDAPQPVESTPRPPIRRLESSPEVEPQVRRLSHVMRSRRESDAPGTVLPPPPSASPFVVSLPAGATAPAAAPVSID